MKKIGEETKKWMIEAIRKHYTDEEITNLLKENGYSTQDIESCLRVAHSFPFVRERRDVGERLRQRIGSLSPLIKELDKKEQPRKQAPSFLGTQFKDFKDFREKREKQLEPEVVEQKQEKIQVAPEEMFKEFSLDKQEIPKEPKEIKPTDISSRGFDLKKESLQEEKKFKKDEPQDEPQLAKKTELETKPKKKFPSLIKKDFSRPRDTQLAHEVREIAGQLDDIRAEVSKVLIGHEEIVNSFLCAILCDGHVLLEGIPGIAKTLLVRALAKASGCSSKRIQFTVDLLPSDIIGITTYTPERGFETIKGPVFANFIIADEINRSPPKTQSALIESMQEKQVTIAKETYHLPLPFFVMATENPLEASGVYDLPEAQIDRFLFKILMGYPKNKEEEKEIMDTNISLNKFEDFDIKSILSAEKILQMQKVVKKVYIDERIKDYIVKIVNKSRTKDFKYGEFIDWGASPRASIGLFIASKAWALMKGREYVLPEDVRDISHFVLRHRLILNYKARAEGLDSDKVIDEILRIVGV